MPKTESDETWSWRQEGDARVLRFNAFSMRMRTLAFVIMLIALPIGVAVALILIAIHAENFRYPARSTILLIGTGLALPVCILLFKKFRAMASEYVVRLTPTHIEVSSTSRRQSFNLQEIQLLRWRSKTDYARLVLITETQNVSLLAGLRKLKLQNDPSIFLPPIPQDYENHLVKHGFSLHRSRRAPDIVTFRRSR